MFVHSTIMQTCHNVTLYIHYLPSLCALLAVSLNKLQVNKFNYLLISANTHTVLHLVCCQTLPSPFQN